MDMKKLTLVLALLMVLAACGGGAQESPDIIGDWVMNGASIGGESMVIPDNAVISLTADAVNIGGTSACNQYGGSYTINGNSIEIADVFSTMMACEEPLMATETAYLAALEQVDTVTMDGGELVLTGADVELRFSAA